MIGYLLASLPAPRLAEPPAIDPAGFLESCRGFVSEERWRDLEALIGPQSAGTDEAPTAHADGAPRGGSRGARPHDPVARTWLDLEAQIGDAVALRRGANARLDPSPYLKHPSGYRVDVAEAVERAFAAQHPGARERELDELRWRLAEELAAGDPDGFGALYARAVQLRLASRWAQWDAAAGWVALETNLRALEAPHA